MISRHISDVGRGYCKAAPWKLRSLLAGVEHRVNIGYRVADVSDPAGHLSVSKLLGQANQACGIGLVRSIAHGDQRRITQAKPLLQHVASGCGFGAADEAPADVLPGQFLEKGSVHQQRFVADEALPLLRIPFGITAEVKAAENLDQGSSVRNIGSMATQQFQAGVPVVVPAAFGLEGIDVRRRWAPAAVVLYRDLKGASVAAGNITDDTVDVEQQDRGRTQGFVFERLVG